MPRRYKRRSSRSYKLVKPVKYSSETFGANAIFQWLSNNNYTSTLIAGTDVLGTRKVKNFTLTITLKTAASSADFTIPIFFALVFVPEGTTPSTLNLGTTINNNTLQALSYYEPNQNVIIQGCIDAQQVYRYKTRLGRNLNAGDTIMLVWRAASDFSASSYLGFTLNYALAF